MRWPVENVLELLGSGMTFEQIISDHPELTTADLQSCIEYARLAISGEVVRVA